MTDRVIWPHRRLVNRLFPALDEHTAIIVRGAVVALVVRIVGAACTFVLNVVVARMFGATGSGAYSLGFTAMTIATVFGRMGMDNAIVRFVAAHASADDWPSVKGVYQTSIRAGLLASIVTAVAMVLCAPALASRVFHDPTITGMLRWMAIAAIPMVVLTLQSQALRALKLVGASVLVATVITPALAILVTVVLGRSHGPLGAAWAYGAAALVTAMIGRILWIRATPTLSRVKGDFPFKTLYQSSMPLLWATSMALAMNWIATFTLGAWGSLADVGIFNAATRVATMVSFVLVAVDNISAPTFAELHLSGDVAALARTARNTVRLMLLLAAPALLAILIAPRAIMGVFGAEFRRGGMVLVILAASQAVSVVAGSVGSLLMMSGHERQVRDSNALAAVTCFLLAIMLVPTHGALGAALAVMGSLTARNIYELLMVRKHLGIGLLLLRSRVPQ